MSIKTAFCFILLGLATGVPACAQGTFQNLSFESASVPATQPPTDPGPPLDVTIALPGWSAFIGTNQVGTVRYNNATIGTASLSLIGTDAAGLNVLEGNFSALLQAGLHGPGANIPSEVSLRQTGMLPSDAQSLQFKALSYVVGVVPPFSVSVGGQNLVLAVLESTPNFTLYGADVAAFAGATRELRFTVTTPDGRLNNLFLDSIRFGPVIPEPGTVALLAVGAATLLWRVRKRNA